MRFTPRYIHQKEVLESYLNQVENQQLEFKKVIPNAIKIAKTLCAFANTQGGRILVGVDDYKQTHPINIEEQMYLIDTASQYHCSPQIELEFMIHDDGENEILEAWVPLGKQLPYAAHDKNMNWKIYYRQDDEVVFSSQLHEGF